MEKISKQDQTMQGWYKDPKGEGEERYYFGNGEWSSYTRRISAVDGNAILKELRSIKTFIGMGTVAIVLALWITAFLFR
jgi:hypothetical protein